MHRTLSKLSFALSADIVLLQWVSLFTELDHWSGPLEWTSGLNYWTAECGVKGQAIPTHACANVTRVRQQRKWKR